MPGIAPAAEQNAAIVFGLGRVGRVEVLEGRRAVGRNTALVVKDDCFATPTPVPIILGIQLKNLRTDFSFRITVGGNFPTIRRKMPVETKAHAGHIQ
jgi:hypothetical protein